MVSAPASGSSARAASTSVLVDLTLNLGMWSKRERPIEQWAVLMAMLSLASVVWVRDGDHCELFDPGEVPGVAGV